MVRQGRSSQLTASVYTVPHCTVSAHAMAAATKKNLKFLKNLIGGLNGISKGIKDALQSVRGFGSPCHILLTTPYTHNSCHRPVLILSSPTEEDLTGMAPFAANLGLLPVGDHHEGDLPWFSLYLTF